MTRYNENRPMIVRTKTRSAVSGGRHRDEHYVMTAAEVGEFVVRRSRDDALIGMEIVPVDQLSELVGKSPERTTR